LWRSNFRAWDYTPNGTPMFKAIKKLQRCKKRLKAWDRDHFGNVKKIIKQIKERLWRAEEVLARTGVFDEVACLKFLTKTSINPHTQRF